MPDRKTCVSIDSYEFSIFSIFSGLNSQWFTPCATRPSYAYPTQPPPPPVQTLNTYASLQNNIGNFRDLDSFLMQENMLKLQYSLLGGSPPQCDRRSFEYPYWSSTSGKFKTNSFHSIRASIFNWFFRYLCRGHNSNGQRGAQSNECHIITIGHNTIATPTTKLFIVYTTFVATLNLFLGNQQL